MATLRIMGIIIFSVLVIGFINWGFFHPPARPGKLETKVVKEYETRLNKMNEEAEQSSLGQSDAEEFTTVSKRGVAEDNGLTVAQVETMIEKVKVWNEYAQKHPEVIDKSVIERPGESGQEEGLN